MKRVVVDVENHFMFEIFSLPVAFDIDLDELNRRYFALQAICHPDRLTTATPRERLMAASKTAELNEAYQTLRHPIKRAAEILKANGFDVPGTEGQTIQDSNLLMDVLSWQEAISEIQTPQDRENLKARLSAEYDLCCKEFMKSPQTQFLRLTYLYKTLDRLNG